MWTYIYIFFYYIRFFPPNYLKIFHMYRKVARLHWMFTIPSPRCTILPLLAHLWALSLSKLSIYCHWTFGEFVVAVTAFYHYFSKYLLRTRMFFPHNHSTNNMLMQYYYLKYSLYFKFSLPITSVKGASILGSSQKSQVVFCCISLVSFNLAQYPAFCVSGFSGVFSYLFSRQCPSIWRYTDYPVDDSWPPPLVLNHLQ